MSDNWSRIVNTTITKYFRTVEDAVMRNRKLLAMLMDRGRVSMNNSGKDMDWKVKFKRGPLQGLLGGDTLTFAQRDRWRTATLDWRGFAVTDSITKTEREKNKGTEAIVKVFSEMAKCMASDLDDGFGDQLYVDGNAAGQESSIHGIESFMGTSGPATNGYVGTPSDTYAGLSTALGNQGGTWSQSGGATTWPSGTGDAHYDFFSPLIVDYTDTAWQAATKTWPNTCIEAIRYGITKGQRNKSKSGKLDLILLENELYRNLKDKYQAEENIYVARNEGKGSLYSLGFTDVLNVDGTDVTFEYGVPSAVGYGWCLDLMEIMSLQSVLFKTEGPDRDIANQSDRVSVDFIGNVRFGNENGGVRNFIKMMSIT